MLKTLFAAVLAVSLMAFTPLNVQNMSVVRLTGDSGDFCSGTLIDAKKGLILTAAHCAKGVSKYIDVPVVTPDGKEKLTAVRVWSPLQIQQSRFDLYGTNLQNSTLSAKFVALDEDRDLALVQYETSNFIEEYIGFRAAKLYEGTPFYGQEIVAIGMPLRRKATIAFGQIVKPLSTPEEESDLGHKDLELLIHDAYMNKGSSGGGIFTMTGELIGVTNWVLKDGTGGIGWAVHPRSIKKFLSEYNEGKHLIND